MINIELTFYRAMLWMLRFELAFSTGNRNPDSLAVIREDIANLEAHVDRLEIQRV